MNWDRMKGNRKQLKRRIKEEWGRLTDDDLDQIEGKKERLIGRLQERYGLEREEAEEEVEEWERGAPV